MEVSEIYLLCGDIVIVNSIHYRIIGTKAIPYQRVSHMCIQISNVERVSLIRGVC